MQPGQRDLKRRIADRDAAIRRVRRATALAFAGMIALAVSFAGLAAKAFPGRSSKTAPAVTDPASGSAERVERG